MIRINLLPDELRQPEGLSRPIMLAMAGCLAIVLAAGAWAWFADTQKRAADLALANLDDQIAAMRARATAYEALDKDVREARKRRETILAIRQSKTSWSRKLHQVTDLVPPHVWIEKIDMRESPLGATEADGGTFTMSCVSRGTDMGRVSRFREGLKRHRPFWSAFDSMDPPRTDLRVSGEEFVEEDRQNWAFDVVLRMKPQRRLPTGGTAGGTP